MLNQNVSKFSFFQTSIRFHSALATFEPQDHVEIWGVK